MWPCPSNVPRNGRSPVPAMRETEMSAPSRTVLPAKLSAPLFTRSQNTSQPAEERMVQTSPSCAKCAGLGTAVRVIVTSASGIATVVPESAVAVMSLPAASSTLIVFR